MNSPPPMETAGTADYSTAEYRAQSRADYSTAEYRAQSRADYSTAEYRAQFRDRIFTGMSLRHALDRALYSIKPQLLRVARLYPTADGSVRYIARTSRDYTFVIVVHKSTSDRQDNLILTWPGGRTSFNIWSLLDTDGDFRVTSIDTVPYVDVDPLPAGCFNLWPGYRAEVVARYDLSRIERILFHLRVLAGGDVLVYHYLSSWLSYLVGNTTTAKTTRILLVLSSAGTGGKTLFVKWLITYLIGARSAVLLSKFPSTATSVRDKLLCVIKEPSWRKHVPTILHLLDAPRLTIDRPGVSPYSTTNITNYICITSAPPFDGVPSELRSRICGVRCSDKYANDSIYFERLLENPVDTARHFLAYLRNLPTSARVNLSDIPIGARCS
jgi:hypothetical protein